MQFHISSLNTTILSSARPVVACLSKNSRNLDQTVKLFRKKFGEVFFVIEWRWDINKIFYYSDNDKKKAEAFCELMKNTPKKVTFIRLEDIKKYKQLSLFEMPV